MSFNQQQQQQSSMSTPPSPLIWFLLFDSATGKPYKGTSATKVKVHSLADIDDLRDAVKAKCPNKLSSVDSGDLLVYKTKAAFDKRNAAVDEGNEEPLKSSLSLDGLGTTEEEALVVVVPSSAATKRPLFFEQYSSDLKLRLYNSKRLVDTSGADFVYSDRSGSFKVLADCLEKRHSSWKQEQSDRNLHPIPFLADGPGSGKSRFLQELPYSFIDFVQQGTYCQDFKDIFKSPVCINISFSNGSPYSLNEALAIQIEQSVCLRILYQFETESYSNFGSFYDSFKSQEFSLSGIFNEVGASCIILGIDEVNKVYEIGVQYQKVSDDTKERLLSGLFGLVGGFSCAFSPIFIPVLAGTVIGPIKSVVRESTHPPLHIPLPLLSFESCLDIFAKKNTQLVPASHQLRQLLSDCGGHCRSLEILYDGMLNINSQSRSFWDDVAFYVRHWLNLRYDLSDFPLGSAIAFSFLGRPVKRIDSYPEKASLNFQDLEEKGLIKLDNGIIRIPYFFVSSFLLTSKTTNYSKFWTTLLIEKDFWWQDWEVFNRNYNAFRLSLFAYLGETTVSLKKFFAGAKMNIPVDIDIKIPSLAALKVSKIDYRYPSTRAPAFDIGDNVLNGDGAPFDSFLYLDTTTKPLLFAFQMKLAQHDSTTQQVISNDTVNHEFNKINNSVSEYVAGTDFVAIILGRCRGTFSENMLPSKCVVVSKEQQMNFYGESYYHRLNNGV